MRASSADPGHRADRRGLGHRRRRRANPLQPLRRAGIQPRAGGNWHGVGRRGRGPAGGRSGRAHALGRRISFRGYKRAMVICYVIHGGAYVLFSQMRSFAAALFSLRFSRAGVAVSSVLNTSQLLRRVPDEFRGQGVFDHRSPDVVYHDGFDDGGRHRLAISRSAPDWGGGGRAEFDHGGLLGLGAFLRPAAGTRGRRRASGGCGGAWRTNHLVCRLACGVK